MQTVFLLLPMLLMLALAAGIDLKHRRIPNWLTVTLASWGFVASMSWSTPIASPWLSLAGAGVGLALNLPLFALRIRGGGDVKLFGAVGAWIGPLPLLFVFVLSTVLAMVLAVFQAISARKLRPVLENSATLAVGLVHGTRGGLAAMTDAEGEFRSADRHVPYAVPVLVSVIALIAMN
jgi:prepilin peptidase CpaA